MAKKKLTRESNLKICQLLQAEFQRRCRHSKSYSLRRYAKFLEIDQSYLSKILTGRITMSDSRAAWFAEKLGLSESEVKKVFSDVNFVPQSMVARSENELALLFDWYHFAILECFRLDHFLVSPSAVAEFLGISQRESDLAFETLTQLELIQRTDGAWHLVSKNNKWSETDTKLDARQALHLRFLEKTADAIQKTSPQERLNLALTIGISSAHFLQFKERLTEVLATLAMEFQGPDSFDQIFQLVVVFHPVSKKRS